MSDIGAGPPSAWQRPQLSRSSGKMSTLYENGDVLALCASTVVEVDDSTRPAQTSPSVPQVMMRA